MKLGILAYGSLINDPGDEIKPLITSRISCTTPFPVEFARLSSTRSDAPTIVPFKDGISVNAEILVLDDKTSLEDAKNMLWRREIRATDKSKKYKETPNPGTNKVTVKSIDNFQGVELVLYTHIGSNMGIMNRPSDLAYFGIQSILNEAGADEKDGLRYLLNAKKNGIVTKLSPGYETEVLKQTGTKSLDEAIEKLDLIRPKNLARLAEEAEFEKKVTEIADLIGEYGFKKTLGGNQPGADLQEFMKEKQTDFIINVHEGFKQAQKKALDLMLGLQDEKQQLKEAIKQANISRARDEVKKLQVQSDRISIREKIIRQLMDAIAWHLIKGQLYIARRLYQEVAGDKILRDSNFESLIKVVDYINEDKNNFALITDLTGYIQTGDLLCTINGQIVVSEVKEGARNHEILDILMESKANDTSLEDAQEKYSLDKNSYKQLKRQARQFETMENFVKIINTDQGFDTSAGLPIKIITPKEPAHLYTERLIALKEQLETRNLWAYDIIDECLHIGIYKGHFKSAGRTILKSIAENSTENYIIINFISILNSLNRPMLFLPFEKQFIFDLMFGRVNMLFMIDIDKYMLLYDDYGMKATWGTRKETMKAKEEFPMNGMFIVKNRGIKITTAGKPEMWLAYGTFFKMVFDSIHPAYQAYSARYTLEIEQN